VLAGFIAKWDGSSWSALGSGLSTVVAALAVSDSHVYAGGFLTTANHIAKWDGSSWSALGSGIGRLFPAVYALAASGNDVYVGGSFTTATNNGSVVVNVNCIAKWNGSDWRALGSGMNGGVRALAVSGNDLYAGGGFTTAGGKVSPYLARAYLERPALSIVHSDTDVTLSWPTFYETFALQQNANAANANTWSNANYPLTTNGPTKTATVPITPTNHFFRLIGN
jgi:hypothetical protein